MLYSSILLDCMTSSVIGLATSSCRDNRPQRLNSLGRVIAPSPIANQNNAPTLLLSLTIVWGTGCPLDWQEASMGTRAYASFFAY